MDGVVGVLKSVVEISGGDGVKAIRIESAAVSVRLQARCGCSCVELPGVLKER